MKVLCFHKNHYSILFVESLILTYEIREMCLVDKFINEYLIILIRVYQSMSACRDENEKIVFPQIRFNKHFRIRSASKDKILPSQDLSTVKSSRKEKKEGHKRTFS